MKLFTNYSIIINDYLHVAFGKLTPYKCKPNAHINSYRASGASWWQYNNIRSDLALIQILRLSVFLELVKKN